jgi:hypothetical protein
VVSQKRHTTECCITGQELQAAHDEKHLQSVPPESVTKFEPDEYLLVRLEHNSLRDDVHQTSSVHSGQVLIKSCVM